MVNPKSFNGGFEQFQDVLEALARLKGKDSKELADTRVQVVHDGHSFSIRVGKFSFLDKIKRKFLGFITSFLIRGSELHRNIKQIQYSSLRDLKALKLMFEHIEGCVTKEESSSDSSRARLIQDAMGGVKELFHAYSGRSDDKRMTYRHDLLEAVSVATREGDMKEWLKQQGAVVSRIAAKPLVEVSRSAIKAHQIPLFRREHLVRAVQLMKAKFAGWKPPPLLTDIAGDRELGPLLDIESVRLAAITERLYKHHNTSIIDLSGKYITSSLGKKYKKRLPAGCHKAHKLMKFFKSMHILPETEIGGELYSYSEMFTRGLRAEESLDGAFQRTLSPEATKVLLKEQRKVQAEITNLLGSKKKSPVISSAFCRLRMLEVPKGSVSTKFHITGKALNESEDTVRVSETETSYGGDFLFSIQNMLGNADDVDIHERGLEELDLESLTPRKGERSDPEALRHKYEHLYRTFLSRAIDREDATMVVQRLAPSDIHHYVEPVGGRALSVSEACAVLKKMARVSADDQDVKTLEALQKQFEEQERMQGKQGYVAVGGTRQSVSTLATKHASPLSQNDRKIMMVQHADGSIAIHTFIGAVGVNNVALESRVDYSEVGEDRGAMGFGDDSSGERDRWAKRASSDDVRDIINRGRSYSEDSIHVKEYQDDFIEAGREKGDFAMGGSTVVSIYFQKDFLPTEEMAKAMRGLRYHDDGERMSRAVEMQVNMGDVIGVPTEFVIIKSLVGLFGENTQDLDDFISSRRDEDYGFILEALIRHIADGTMVDEPETPQQKFHNALITMAKKNCAIADKDPNAETLTLDEGRLMQTVIYNLNKKIGDLCS